MMRRMVIGCVAVLVAWSVSCPAAGADTDHAPRTPINHFVVLFQENHTFDNYFGTRPGVDGIPPGTCIPVRVGAPKPCVKPFHVGDLGITDLAHTEAQFERQYRGGRMDGFVEANSDHGRDGSQAMGYYDDRDLPYYWNVADEYVLFDRFFSSARGGSLVNHMFAVTGQAGLKTNSERIPPGGWGDLPTIFDRLQAAGVSWKFYIANYDPGINFRTRDQVPVDRAAQVIWAPLLGYARYLDDPELNKHIVDMDQYYDDVANGTLPAVSYLVPSGDSEHPPGRVQAGQRLVKSLITQLMRSELWSSTAFMWAYDDWGGWYDHVPPPQVDKWGYGFRVPALLVSPYAKRGYVSHEVNDFTSVLAFIEANWNLEPLARRDARANDLMDAFDFSAPPRAPAFLPASRAKPPPPDRPNPAPVYGLYALVLCGAGAVIGGAMRRTRGVESELPKLEGEDA